MLQDLLNGDEVCRIGMSESRTVARMPVPVASTDLDPSPRLLVAVSSSSDRFSLDGH